MESFGSAPANNPEVEKPRVEGVESQEEVNEFTPEQRDKDIEETIEILSKRFFGFGFKKEKKDEIGFNIFDLLAEKYKVYPDLVINSTQESDTDEVKRETERAAEFINVYTQESIAAVLDKYFEQK